MFAVEPFLGAGTLRQTRMKMRLCHCSLKLLLWLRLANPIWHSACFGAFLRCKVGRKGEQAIRGTIDPYTLFATASALLDWQGCVDLFELPYALLINPNDRVIHSGKIIERFKTVKRQILVIQTDLPHHPPCLDREYLESMLLPSDMIKLVSYFLEARPSV